VAEGYDAIVVGAGHNGLVTAAYLGRAGLRTLVLERRDQVGGALATTELGKARVPAAAHTVGRLRPSVVRDLGLRGHGFTPVTPAVRAFAPQPDGSSVTLWGDPERTAEGLRGLSPTDADGYVAFDKRIRAVASFVAYLQVATPPNLKTPSLKDAHAGLGLARALRGMSSRGRREAIRLLPMAVADLVGEAFESDALRGALAVRGVQYTSTGPWSSGSSAVFLNDSAGNDGGAAGQTTFARGGPGALAEALASAVRTFRGDIRTGVEVERVVVGGDRVRGVVLQGGEEIHAPIVASGADPKRTLLGLLDPVTLGPSLAWRARNYRTSGVTAKVNLVLSGLPSFAADGGDDPERLSGRILIAPGIDYLERGFDAAKYGRISEAPFLEATIPTLADPSLAPDGTHVMSVILQWAPYALREGDWESERSGLADLALKTLEPYAPGIAGLVVESETLSPVDLERDYGLTGGHALHGEASLDQFFAWRPLLGHARYRMPVRGLYLCGSGAHPGGGVTGGPGANAAREILADRRARSSRTRPSANAAT
jgi:phytoene dehydrogenase-like protein